MSHLNLGPSSSWSERLHLLGYTLDLVFQSRQLLPGQPGSHGPELPKPWAAGCLANSCKPCLPLKADLLAIGSSCNPPPTRVLSHRERQPLSGSQSHPAALAPAFRVIGGWAPVASPSTPDSEVSVARKLIPCPSDLCGLHPQLQ